MMLYTTKNGCFGARVNKHGHEVCTLCSMSNQYRVVFAFG